jgi:hypothetical protein
MLVKGISSGSLESVIVSPFSFVGTCRCQNGQGRAVAVFFDHPVQGVSRPSYLVANFNGTLSGVKEAADCQGDGVGGSPSRFHGANLTRH